MPFKPSRPVYAAIAIVAVAAGLAAVYVTERGAVESGGGRCAVAAAKAAALKPLATGDLAAVLLRELEPGQMARIYVQSADLTIYSVWSEGGLRGPPHDHATAAIIGLVEGVEQYKTYQSSGDQCQETGLKRVTAPSVAVLGHEAIHAMWNEPGEGGL